MWIPTLLARVPPRRVDSYHTTRTIPTIIDKVYIVDRDLVAAVAEHRVLAKAIDRAPVEHKHPVGVVDKAPARYKFLAGVFGTNLEAFSSIGHQDDWGKFQFDPEEGLRTKIRIS